MGERGKMNNYYSKRPKDEKEIENMINKNARYFGRIFSDCMEFIKQQDDDNNTTELNDYISRYRWQPQNKRGPDVSTKKLKVLAHLFRSHFDSHDIDKILSFLELHEYGWHGDEYYINNPCLSNFIGSSVIHCKSVTNYPEVESAQELFRELGSMFLDKEYGDVTLYIFCYCLTALFSSKLDQDHFPIPFFLQISCQRSSVFYQLIQEIVKICDVNSGLTDRCPNRNFYQHNYKYGSCGYTHQVFYPTHSTEKDITDLVENFKDLSVIISGDENEHQYRSLLRETANIPNKKKPFDAQDTFHILPVFISSSIKSHFDNILEIPEVEVSDTYLRTIINNKKMLASLVFELIMDSRKYLFPNMDGQNDNWQHPFSSELRIFINKISQDYPDLPLVTAGNVGILLFFFKGFLNAFQAQFNLPIDENFSVFLNKDGPIAANLEANTNFLFDQIEKSLVRFHRLYLPKPRSAGINDSDALRLAKLIEKHYGELNAAIRVTPTSLENDRYIFEVTTLQKTTDRDLSGKNADTVQRRLKNYEHFSVDLSNKTAIRIIVAKQPLKDNSLIEILTHDDFNNSKMKIPYAVGYDEIGAMCIEDVAEFPHLLLGGATQSGKSTALVSLIMSILFTHRTGNVSLLILDLLGKDPSDFEVFNGHPALSCPVIKDVEIAKRTILYLRGKMEERKLDKNLKNLPFIVCIIDEFPRLFSNAHNKSEKDKLTLAMNELLATGRHARIHLVLTAQNPQKKQMVCDVANLNAKIAFKCSSHYQSVAILGRGGANKLTGKGQMIFDCNGTSKRLQGSFIPKKDMKTILDLIKDNFKQENKHPFFIDITELSKENTISKPKSNETKFEEKLADIIMYLLEKGEISNKAVKDKAKVGYDKANIFMKRLEEYGLISSLEDGRSARKINTVEKIDIIKVQDILIRSKDHLTSVGYPECDIEKILKEKLSI